MQFTKSAYLIRLTADERREWRIRLHLKCCQSEEEEVVEFLSNLAHVTEARSSQKARTSRRAAQREVDISKEVIAMCIKGILSIFLVLAGSLYV